MNTPNADLARMICNGLVMLWNDKTPSIDRAPVEVPQKALALYFDLAPDALHDEITDKAAEVLPKNPSDLDLKVAAGAAWASKARQYIQENERLQMDVARLLREVDQWKQKYQALERAAIGQAVTAGQRATKLSAALELFGLEIQDNSTQQRSVLVNAAAGLLSSLPAELQTTADITAAHIDAWVNAQVADADDGHKKTRRLKQRVIIGRFINWAARAGDYPSQMTATKRVRWSESERERGEIVWHDIQHIEDLCGQLDPYWEAVVATLAYAGLRLSEALWLRVGDVDLQRGQIHVATVEDPDAPDSRHLLKRANSKRSVAIHAKLLAPRLNVHAAGGLTGEHFFFPVREDIRHRTRGAAGSRERWLMWTFSDWLNRWLPEGMNALTLRHTFGSLLIRSGKSYAEVAAAMGNTPEIVARHYARLKGHEVDVDF